MVVTSLFRTTRAELKEEENITYSVLVVLVVVDFMTDTLYWLDSRQGTLVSYNLMTRERTELVTNNEYHQHSSTLDVFEVSRPPSPHPLPTNIRQHIDYYRMVVLGGWWCSMVQDSLYLVDGGVLCYRIGCIGWTVMLYVTELIVLGGWWCIMSQKWLVVLDGQWRSMVQDLLYWVDDSAQCYRIGCIGWTVVLLCVTGLVVLGGW